MNRLTLTLLGLGSIAILATVLIAGRAPELPDSPPPAPESERHVPQIPASSAPPPPLDDRRDIIVESPTSGDLIASPTSIRGNAPSGWFLEGEFTVVLRDADGNNLGDAIVEANGDWLTDDWSPFEATLHFSRPHTPSGTLLFLQAEAKDGAKAESYALPVRFELPDRRL